VDKDQVKNKPFYGVALFFIIAGATIFAVSCVSILYSVYGEGAIMTSPVMKSIGGLIVMALGYIQLELELMRK
jgi:hypothetical protein